MSPLKAGQHHPGFTSICPPPDTCLAQNIFVKWVNTKSYSNVSSVFQVLLSGGNLLLKEEPYRDILIPKGHWPFSNTLCTFTGIGRRWDWWFTPANIVWKVFLLRLAANLWGSSLAGRKWFSRKFKVLQLLACLSGRPKWRGSRRTGPSVGRVTF